MAMSTSLSGREVRLARLPNNQSSSTASVRRAHAMISARHCAGRSMSGVRNTLQAKDRRQEGGFNLLQRERDLFGIGLARLIRKSAPERLASVV
jgi:hypothetical protein